MFFQPLIFTTFIMSLSGVAICGKDRRMHPTGLQSPLIILNHLFESFAYKHGSPAAAKHFNKYDNSL